jgi:two-component system response regulator NreC
MLARALLDSRYIRSFMTASPLPLRILIADDHALIREGTCAVLGRQPGWKVCGQAANGREAVAQALALKPDIVVLDMTMPELNGLDAAIQIRRQLPDTEVVLLSGYGSEELIHAAFQAGVKSFVLKTGAQELLLEAIRSVAQHKPFLTPTVAEILLSPALAPNGSANNADPAMRLSAREREVLQFTAEGKTNKDVATALNIGIRTAENHRASILRKLHLNSAAELVRYAIRNKMIDA